MKNYILDILKFIKSPNDVNIGTINKFSKMKLFIIAFILNALFSTFFLLLNEILKYFNLAINDSSELEKIFWEHPLLSWVLIVFVMPILEELVFRSQLRYKANLFIKMITPHITRKGRDEKILRIREKWDKYYFVIFYCFTLLFALAHSSNFNTNDNSVLGLIVLIAPIFVTGVMLGYVRVRINLKSSILFHSLFNFIAVSLALIFT